MDRDELEAMQLGELPPTRAAERAELYGDQRDAPLYGQPGAQVSLPSVVDQRRRDQFAVAANRAPEAGIAVDYLIQTTFDARPINGQDFVKRGSIELDVTADPPILSGQVVFTVPPGRVGILRHFRWHMAVTLFNDGGDLEDGEAVFASVLVNGLQHPHYVLIPSQYGALDCYAIAGENHTIAVELRVNTDASIPDDYATFGFVTMYGNLLQSVGREQNFTPANQYKGDRLS